MLYNIYKDKGGNKVNFILITASLLGMSIGYIMAKANQHTEEQ